MISIPSKDSKMFIESDYSCLALSLSDRKPKSANF